MKKMKIPDIINKFRGPKTTSLDKKIEEEAYLKEKIKQAEIIGKARAEAEAKEEIKEIKTKPKAKTKSGFAKFQDYATKFANEQKNTKPMELNFNLGGEHDKGEHKTSGKGSRARTLHGY